MRLYAKRLISGQGFSREIFLDLRALTFFGWYHQSEMYCAPEKKCGLDTGAQSVSATTVRAAGRWHSRGREPLELEFVLVLAFSRCQSQNKTN